MLDAQVQQRRWERALGLSIREGQARGEIETPDEARVRAGKARQRVEDFNALTPKPKPTDYADKYHLAGAQGANIYSMTDTTDDAGFDAALDEARADGNVSRANVVRKIKEANGTAPARHLAPGAQHLPLAVPLPTSARYAGPPAPAACPSAHIGPFFVRAPVGGLLFGP